MHSATSACVRILDHHGGRGPDGPERSDREPRVGRGGRGHRDVPPDVTVGLDEVEEGADVDVVVELVAEPDSSDDEVDAPLVVEVVLLPVETDTPPLERGGRRSGSGHARPGMFASHDHGQHCGCAGGGQHGPPSNASETGLRPGPALGALWFGWA